MFIPDFILVTLLFASIVSIIFHKKIIDFFETSAYNQALALADRRMTLFVNAGYYDNKSEQQFNDDYQEAINDFYNKR